MRKFKFATFECACAYVPLNASDSTHPNAITPRISREFKLYCSAISRSELEPTSNLARKEMYAAVATAEKSSEKRRKVTNIFLCKNAKLII
jgi:ureidoglycolate hydrolase